MCAIMDYNGKEDLSTSTFQQKIFDWFDRRGMLSELRSHLRHQMITAFQNSSIGNSNQTGRFTVDANISPALQAFLLLVAEFLAQQEYHYTVSILVAEVPLLATFPKFSALVSHLSDTQLSLPSRDLPRYSEKDVLEILETLGIERNSESSHHILRLYTDSVPRESLLACVLTALPAVANSHSDSPGIEPNRNPENLTYCIEEIRLLLLRAQLDKIQLRQLEDILRRFHASATTKAKQEERIVCLKEAESNNQQLRVWENAARDRQRNVEVELEASKRQLKEVTAQLRVQHDDVLRRLHRVQKHAEEVRVKEEKVVSAKYENEQFRKHLEAWNEQLVAEEARLEEGYQSLRKERDHLRTLRAETQSASEREKSYISSINEQQEICANLQSELEKTKLEMSEVRMQLKTKSKHVEPCRGAEKEVASRSTQTEVRESSNTSSSVAEPGSSSSSSEVDPPQVQAATKKAGDRQSGLGSLNLVRHLRQENAELQERNVQLQRRLEEVTEQAAIWASSPSRLLEPAVVRPPGPPPPPPPPLPPPPQLRRMARSCELGAGEELVTPPVRQASSNRGDTLHLHGREWKRTPPKQLLMHVEHSEYPSSDESVSEEVLRETGRRLRHLDAESELIDRRRKELKNSAMSTTASYMFIPTASTSTLPPPPAARPYEPGSMAARLSLFPPEKTPSSLNFGLHDFTLGRYSQITWPEFRSTSTPIRSLDSPLRRGVRSHLSLSRDRRSSIAGAESVRNSEERVPTSPLQSTERNAFLRLDAALDTIKLAREDIRFGAKADETKTADETKYRSTPLDSVPNGETTFRPDIEFDSPSQIRDRVMASLRASTPSVTSAGFTTVPIPAAAPDYDPVAAVSVERETIEMPEREKSIVDVSLPRRISSAAMPRLPLAPIVIAERTEESPKDSTLNEVPTPASSPSMSGKLEIVGRIVSKASKEDIKPKSSNSSSDRESKQRKNGEKSAEEPAKSAKELDKSQSISDGKDTESPGGAVGVLSLKSNVKPVAVDKSNGFPQLPEINAEPFASDSYRPSQYIFKEEERILEESSSSNNTQISAGSADDVLKDDSW